MRHDPTPEQLAKLPKWARDHIALLTMKMTEAEQRLEARQSQEPTRVFVPDYTRNRGEYLPDNSLIRFWPVSGKRCDIDVTSYNCEPGEVEVRTGLTRLVVLPCSSNVVRVRVFNG